MTKDEVQLFLAGLKTVIKRTWPTQSEFASGVTSKVNLSNILNGNSGTSQAMVQKLADRAGMSVDELVAVGKGAVRTRKTDAESNRPNAGQLPALDINSDMSSQEMLGNTAEYSMQITENVLAHVKTVTNAIKTLAEERDRLLMQLQQEQTVVSMIVDAVQIVNRDMKVIYRTSQKTYNHSAKDTCDAANCRLCHNDCLVEQVFASGQVATALTSIDGSWFYRKAQAMPSLDGKVTQVLVYTQKLDELMLPEIEEVA